MRTRSFWYLMIIPGRSWVAGINIGDGPPRRVKPALSITGRAGEQPDHLECGAIAPLWIASWTHRQRVTGYFSHGVAAVNRDRNACRSSSRPVGDRKGSLSPLLQLALRRVGCTHQGGPVVMDQPPGTLTPLEEVGRDHGGV